jgi:transposase
MQAEALIADKAVDADKRVIEPLTAAGKTVVIPPKSNRRSPRTYDPELYKAHHLIENFFARLKQFRAMAKVLRSVRWCLLSVVGSIGVQGVTATRRCLTAVPEKCRRGL